MPKRKPGLTREQHQALGKELRQARNAMGAAYLSVANSYNRRVFAVARILRKIRIAQSAIDTARSDLEGILASEHEDWETTDYYGSAVESVNQGGETR